MKKTKITAILLIAVMLTGLFAGCSKPAPAPNGNEASTVEIKYATVGSEDHQYTIAAQLFKDKIEAKSNGRIKVTLFPNAQLGGEREMAEGVKLGTIQMTTVTSDGTLPAWIPELQVLSIPYLFKDKAHAYKVLDGALTDELNPKFEAAGFKNLGFVELGFRHFTNNKKDVKSAADMENLKIRVQEAPIWFALIDSLKATATPVPFNELYTALQQGVVDGQENPLGTIYTSKFYEVQKYLTLDGHTYAAGSVIMNLDFFNKLSDDDKKLVEECVNEMKAEQRQIITDKETGYLAELEKAGMVITEPDRDSFVKATENLPNLEKVKALVNPSLVELVKSVD